MLKDNIKVIMNNLIKKYKLTEVEIKRSSYN